MFMRFWETFRAMDPNRRFLAVTIAAGLIVGVIAIGWWARHITYGVLFSRLPAEEAGQIIDQLDQMKVSYRVSDGGSSILVPSNQVPDVRIRLAAAGLPRTGSVGFEIFDKTNLGMTDFLQKVNYRRALEGELGKSIASLREVSAARVHIVIPENRLFTQDQKPTTASVIVKVTGALDRGKVAAITHLIASAVEGLDPSRVTVLDQNGTLLSAAQDESTFGATTSRQLELQKNVETYLQDKAQSLLDGVLGQRKAIVRVNATLNFEQAEKTIDEYDPDNLAIVSQEQTIEKTSDNNTDTEGAKSGGTTSKENTVTNYEVNHTVQKIVAAVGTIQRLTVSVIVDGTYATPEGAADDKPPVFTPRPQGELDRIGALVKAAVGLAPERNDHIEIVSVAFDNTNMQEEKRELEKMEKREFYYDIAYKVGYGLAILAALFVGLKILKKVMKFFSSLAQPGGFHGETGNLPQIIDERMPAIMPERRKARLSDQMVQVARERPDEMARVIKTMMVD
jgi:flagellar M-ring protein FliF